jgi:beta-galactosidase
MVKKFFITSSLVLSMVFGVLAQGNEWQDPKIFAINKEPARTTALPYPNEMLAIVDNYSSSPYYQLINGMWKFHWAPKASQAPQNFYSEDYDVSGWGVMPVPGTWEMNGCGTPVYVASGFGFRAPFFEIDPDDTPTGSYRHEFNIPASWDGRRVFIHFEGGTTAMYVWINGRQVGYTENAKCPAEFDITPYIRQGKNTLACRVYKFGDASYMEDQDKWRLAGINRDVFLYSTAQTRIYDFFSHADLDKNYRNGIFSSEITLKNYNNVNKTQTVTVDIFDKIGKKVISRAKKVVIPAQTTTETSISGTVSSPLKWTAETPDLYTMIITLKDEKGEIVEVTSHKIGFRKVEIKDAQIFINGKKIWFKGVNLHEFNANTGEVVTVKEMMRNIQLMKELNINAVRTSHYPQPTLWYKLCDLYGIYLVDESNLESHGVRHLGEGLISNLPDWRAAHLDRIVSVVERDKNHPSVVMWSLGNESANGEAFTDNYNWAKKRDSSRPTVYEPATRAANTDVSFPMYPGYESMLRDAAQELPRPWLMCEYAHAMGNSMGNMQEYWDVMRSSKNMQGGFIWEWYNHGFPAYDEQGRFYWAFGGDLGSYMKMNSDNFCMDGIVTPDQNYLPHTYVVKHVYQNTWVESVDPASGILTVVNDFIFTDITPQNHTYKWVLLRNGENVGEGAFDVTIPAASKKNVKIDLPVITPGAGVEYFLNVFTYTKQSDQFIPAGFECSKSEIKFPTNDYFSSFDTQSLGNASLNIEKTEQMITVTAGKTVYTAITGVPMQRAQGGPIQVATGAGATEAAGGAMRFMGRGAGFFMTNNGRPVFNAMPSLNFWRAPNDNDFGSGDQTTMRIWEVAGRNPIMIYKDYTENDGAITFDYEAKLRGIEAKVDLKYTVNKDGSLTISAHYQASNDQLPEIMRFGMIMTLSGTYDDFTWYGRGPHENYVDRNTDVFVGIWNGKVADQAWPYYRPQETGNKTDVRWLTLKNAVGKGIMISGLQPLSVSATNNRPEDLDPGTTKKHQHASDVGPRNEVVLCVDLFQRGVGGLNSWGAKPLTKYQFHETEYQYTFTIKVLE